MHANESLLQASQYLQELQRYWWPFCRIMAMLAMAPLLNSARCRARCASSWPSA